MNFIRPEVRKLFLRWQEAVIGAIIVACGVYWSFSSGPVLRWVGVIAIAGGGVIVWEGIRRARFLLGGGGPGIVQFTERQITYLAPEHGGIVSVDDLYRVEIHSGHSGFEWALFAENRPRLLIPSTAEGAEAIYDALAPLSGLNLDSVANANETNQRDICLIWQKDRRALH